MAPISAFTARRARHLLLGAALLSASVLAHSLMAPDTHAAIGGCRSDPVVTLSNGAALDLHATVDDTATDVQQVSYTLSGPKGTSVTGEVDTTVLGPKDRFQYSANGPAGTYSASVKVTTGTPGKSVTAAMDQVDATGTVLSTGSASGQSPQTLQMNVSG
jgi:hypothetical protein